MKAILLILLSLFLAGQAFAEYDIVKRYKLTDDRLKTFEMLRPYGHDFIFDLTASVNQEAIDLTGDLGEVSDAQTDAEKLNKTLAVLDEYNNTEHIINVGLLLGVPLPSFTAFGVKFLPDLRIHARLTGMMGIMPGVLTAENILQLVDDADIASALGVPVTSPLVAEVKEGLKAYIGTVNPGQNIFAVVCPNLSAPVNLACAPLKTDDRFILPDTGDPLLSTFVKADVKGGFNIKYKKDHFFGNLDLYYMARADVYKIGTASYIAKDPDKFSETKDNQQHFAMADYTLGYKNANYSLALGIEEIKIARMSDNIDEAGDLTYTTDPLIRLHGAARFRLSILALQAFAGVHKRKGYDLGDGIYAGADFGAYVWGDRLGLSMRGMVDSEHLTLSPRMKLWFMQLEYMLKQPLSSTTDDDVKVSTIHSVNLRFFF